MSADSAFGVLLSGNTVIDTVSGGVEGTESTSSCESAFIDAGSAVDDGTSEAPNSHSEASLGLDMLAFFS